MSDKHCDTCACEPEDNAVLPALTPALGLGLCDINNLLSDEERRQLNADLAEMAQQRRNAHAAAANIWLS